MNFPIKVDTTMHGDTELKETRLEQLQKASKTATNLKQAVDQIMKSQDAINQNNFREIDALPDFPQRFEKFQEKILEELFTTEKDLILALQKNGSFKREEKVRCEYLARKERLMKMAEEALEKYPNLRKNAALIQKISQYLFFFHEIFKQQSDISKDGKWAIELMESSMPGLTAEIAVLEDEKRRKEELNAQEEMLRFERGFYADFIEELHDEILEDQVAAMALPWSRKSIEDFIKDIEILHEKVMSKIAALLGEEDPDETAIHKSTIKMEILQHKKNMYEQLISDLKALPYKNGNGNESRELLAFRAMVAINKKLREKIDILKIQIEELQEMEGKFQREKFGIAEVKGKQFIVIKIKKINGKKLETFARRLRSALGSKLSGFEIHLLNNLLPESSCIIIEPAARIKTKRIENDPDSTAEFQQIRWIIEETLEDLKRSIGAEEWTQRHDGQVTKFYIIGDMVDPNIGDIAMNLADTLDNEIMRSERVQALASQIGEENPENYEILIPRKIIRKRLRKAADVFMTILERTRSKSRIGQTGQRQQGIREISIPDELAQRRRTYNQSLRGIIEWSAKMAANEQDENRKYALYKKALEILYKVALTLKGKDVKICYTRISDIETILAELKNGTAQSG